MYVRTFRYMNNYVFLCVIIIELVWKVARYTSAGPLFFSEFENYVDGGVLANNPSDYALSAIQNYYMEKRRETLPIALLVSVGTGVYPEEQLGKIDAQEFLHFGKHWFNLVDTVTQRAQNLLVLLQGAVGARTYKYSKCKCAVRTCM